MLSKCCRVFSPIRFQSFAVKAPFQTALYRTKGSGSTSTAKDGVPTNEKEVEMLAEELKAQDNQAHHPKSTNTTNTTTQHHQAEAKLSDVVNQRPPQPPRDHGPNHTMPSPADVLDLPPNIITKKRFPRGLTDVEAQMSEELETTKSDPAHPVGSPTSHVTYSQERLKARGESQPKIGDEKAKLEQALHATASGDPNDKRVYGEATKKGQVHKSDSRLNDPNYTEQLKQHYNHQQQYESKLEQEGTALPHDHNPDLEVTRARGRAAATKHSMPVEAIKEVEVETPDGRTVVLNDEGTNAYEVVSGNEEVDKAKHHRDHIGHYRD